MNMSGMMRHSITLSACITMELGTLMPCALAAFGFISNSKRVGGAWADYH
jgi:hypothetical protein